MSKTKIDYLDKVWNPMSGCAKISPGCANCYAERMSKRLAGRFGYPDNNPFRVTLHSDKLEEPLRWKTPQVVGVCFMGDLFHEDVPEDFIDKVFAVMALSPQHTFLVLTKRPERMRNYNYHIGGTTRRDWVFSAAGRLLNVSRLKGFDWPLPNVYFGVSAENQEQANARIPVLISIPAAKRFVSIEPMIGAVDLFKAKAFTGGPCGGGGESGPVEYGSMSNIDLVILGGESGPGARPVHPDWVRSVRDQCREAGAPFYFKQWGVWAEDKQHGLATTSVRGYRFPDGTLVERVGKKDAGRLLDGKEYLEWPP